MYLPRAITPFGSELVLRGAFTRMNSTPSSGLASFDGSEAVDLGASLDQFLLGQGRYRHSLGAMVEWNGELIVACRWGNAPGLVNGTTFLAFDGTLASLDTLGNWTMLVAPLPEVVPEPWWDLQGDQRSRSVVVIGTDIYAYSLTTYLTDGFSPSYYDHFWRVDQFDGVDWSAVASGAANTHGPTMGGGPASVWDM